MRTNNLCRNLSSNYSRVKNTNFGYYMYIELQQMIVSSLTNCFELVNIMCFNANWYIFATHIDEFTRTKNDFFLFYSLYF